MARVSHRALSRGRAPLMAHKNPGSCSSEGQLPSANSPRTDHHTFGSVVSNSPSVWSVENPEPFRVVVGHELAVHSLTPRLLLV